MPSTGTKMIDRIHAIADDGLRLAEIRTAATTMTSTCTANNNQLTNTAGGIQPPLLLGHHMIS
jgi:hypothetical protein